MNSDIGAFEYSENRELSITREEIENMSSRLCTKKMTRTSNFFACTNKRLVRTKRIAGDRMDELSEPSIPSRKDFIYSLGTFTHRSPFLGNTIDIRHQMF